MRRVFAALLFVLLVAAPAWAWPPQLDEFCYHALEAAPPGWQLQESANLLTAAACAPQLVCIFGDNGAFLEYRLDLDNPEDEENQDHAKRVKLDGRSAIYLQEGDWPRFTYLTVFLPAQVASLTIGVNQDYTYEEMAQLYYAFPMNKLLNSTGKKAK